MIFLSPRGRKKNIIVAKYLIDWDGESKSKFQFGVKRFLYPYWKDDVVTEEFPVAGTRLRLDFVNIHRRIAIEVNGAHHNQIHWFHDNNPLNYLDQLMRDNTKEEWAEKNKYILVQINPDDLPLTKEFFLEKYKIEL